MAAVIGTNAGSITVESPGVWVANRNSPSQVVISGETVGVEIESKKLAEKGFKVIPLKVSDAFHTPKMNAAATAFAASIRSIGGIRAPLPRPGVHHH